MKLGWRLASKEHIGSRQEKALASPDAMVDHAWRQFTSVPERGPHRRRRWPQPRRTRFSRTRLSRRYSKSPASKSQNAQPVGTSGAQVVNIRGDASCAPTFPPIHEAQHQVSDGGKQKGTRLGNRIDLVPRCKREGVIATGAREGDLQIEAVALSVS